MYVCAVSEIKLKGNGEVMFGEVVGKVPPLFGVRAGDEIGRVREGVTVLLSMWLLQLAYVGLSKDIGRELGVYIGI